MGPVRTTGGGQVREDARRAGRRRAAIRGAVLIGGSGEILDFLVPLWAGSAFGASGTAIGVLLAVELVASVLARPVAGWLADTRNRPRTAALGAGLFGLGLAGYALTPTFDLAYAAAAVGGAGGAVFWVTVRAIVSEYLAEDDGAFASLYSAVAFGSWFFWVPAMVLLPALDFRGVFLVLAAVCLVGSGILAYAGRTAQPRRRPTPVPGGLRRFRVLLATEALSGLAAAGVGLLLLLHLQRSFDLDVHQIALVFLPGGIAMTVLPRPLHGLVRRFGRRATFVVASLASAVCAGSLAFAPDPVTIAVLWVLTGASWAALSPITDAAVTESAGERVGTAMSLVGNAVFLGSAAGGVLAGVLYDHAPWAATCLVFAGLIATEAYLGPLALDSLGVRDVPDPESRDDREDSAVGPPD